MYVSKELKNRINTQKNEPFITANFQQFHLKNNRFFKKILIQDINLYFKTISLKGQLSTQ